MSKISDFLNPYKIYFIIAGVTLLLASITGGYLYVRHLQTENATLHSEVTLMQGSINTQKETIKSLTEDIKKINQSKTQLDDVRKNNQKNLDDLNRTFARDGKSFGQLAYAKPGLIEAAINKGTQDKLRCFELLTGQKVNENEKNDMCPNLIK